MRRIPASTWRHLRKKTFLSLGLVVLFTSLLCAGSIQAFIMYMDSEMLKRRQKIQLRLRQMVKSPPSAFPDENNSNNNSSTDDDIPLNIGSDIPGKEPEPKISPQTEQKITTGPTPPNKTDKASQKLARPQKSKVPTESKDVQNKPRVKPPKEEPSGFKPTKVETKALKPTSESKTVPKTGNSVSDLPTNIPVTSTLPNNPQPAPIEIDVIKSLSDDGSGYHTASDELNTHNDKDTSGMHSDIDELENQSEIDGLDNQNVNDDSSNQSESDELENQSDIDEAHVQYVIDESNNQNNIDEFDHQSDIDWPDNQPTNGSGNPSYSNTITVPDGFVDTDKNTITIDSLSDENIKRAFKEIRRVAFGKNISEDDKRQVLLRLFKAVEQHVVPLNILTYIATKRIQEWINQLATHNAVDINSHLDNWNEYMIKRLLSDFNLAALNDSFNPEKLKIYGYKAQEWYYERDLYDCRIRIDQNWSDPPERFVDALEIRLADQSINGRHIRLQPFYNMDLFGSEYVIYLIMLHNRSIDWHDPGGKLKY